MKSIIIKDENEYNLNIVRINLNDDDYKKDKTEFSLYGGSDNFINNKDKEGNMSDDESEETKNKNIEYDWNEN